MELSFKQNWITKLIGYDFTVEYKEGIASRVADALSRREGWTEEVSIALLSIPILNWVDKLEVHYREDVLMKELVNKWLGKQLNTSKYAYKDGLMFYKIDSV